MVSDSDNGKNGTRVLPALAFLGISFIGGGGGTYMVIGTGIAESVVRHDPFTGTQAIELRAEIGHLRDQLNEHKREHPEDVGSRERIATLEANQRIILQQLDRIERKLP